MLDTLTALVEHQMGNLISDIPIKSPLAGFAPSCFTHYAIKIHNDVCVHAITVLRTRT